MQMQSGTTEMEGRDLEDLSKLFGAEMKPDFQIFITFARPLRNT